MHKTKVKANAISNLTDARYFAARGVDWLGFNLQPGDEPFISPAEAKAIKEWVDGVKIVAEVGLATESEMILLKNTLAPDAFQINMLTVAHESPDKLDVPFIREVIVDRNHNVREVINSLNAFSSHCEVFLLDFVKSGISWENLKSGELLSIADLNMICQQFPILLNLNFSTGFIEECLHRVKPYGICLSGSLEQKVGFKSYDELDEIFDLLETFN